MAAEMSCLAGVDGDEKDVDPEINALTLLQEPLRMAGILESTSCNDSLSKPSLKHSSVQDALSNTDMLSPVGLGNVPSSQATPAYDVNSSSMEKEEEKSITPLKTVQEIDTAGIWGFDEESPENSSDNFSSSELHWNPHKEFMQFLWEDPNDSPDAEPKEEVPPPNSQRRRKRKMDMVVMVDPSEDLYPDRSRKSSEEVSDADSQVDSIPFTKVRKSRKFPKSQSLPAETNHPNGTVKGIKHIHYNAPTRNSHDTSPGCELSPLRGKLTMNSHSEEKKSGYPCSKCKLIFKKDHHLQAHMKTHRDPPTISPKPFICRECGHCFRESSLLIEHMAVYHKKRARLTGEVKGRTDKKNVDKNAKLFCPQCPFGTNCPNTFVQHAKTHEKDKRTVKRCDKCSFMTLSQNELRRHNIKQHTVITVRKSIQNHDSGIFSCTICSYKAFSKNVFRNHLMRRHQQSLEEYEAAQSDKDAQQCTEQHVTTCNTPVEDAEFTSKILIKNQISPRRAQSPSKSNNISDLFENSRIRRGLKSHLTESKLDKSINVLLSRQRHGRKAAEQKEESSSCSTSVQGSKSDNGSSDPLPRTLSVDVDNTALPPNGCSLSPGAAERDPNSDSGPRSNIEQSPLKKSPSKRKMSTPYRNTSDQDSCFILPKPLPSPKQQNQLEEDCEEKGIFQGNDADVDSIFDNGIKREKQNIIYTYTRRMSMRGALQASKRLFEKIKTEDPDSNDPEIKEECIETEVCQEPMDTHPVPLRESFTDDVTESESERKNCPYCPAVFESGVGLSNHVRGHLHRAGLSYNERHVVSPEQVACQDKRPRVRRRMSAFRRLKKAFRLEADSETVKSIHSCPLCGDSFDNRTGQSNHIRGHLKKLGKSFATKNKSPLFLLWELMRDKKEFQRALQILGKTQNHYQYDSSAKLEQFSNDFSPSPVEIPPNHSVSSVCTDAKPLMSTFSFVEMESEKRHLQTKLDVKDSLSGSNALIGILKKRRCQEDSRLKGSSPMLRNNQVVPSNSEQSSGSRIASSLPNSISEKGEFNRKVCVHCNATFHSGVSLSNHLRAYAKRKRTALLEGTAIDCKARRQRLRHSSKKKTLPLPQTPEEMYRLTCRFCDLVFQGPLSVQEDWIKHLQRHIMNTSVPHTGLGMVEVTSLPTDPPTLKTDQDGFPTAANDAS